MESQVTIRANSHSYCLFIGELTMSHNLFESTTDFLGVFDSLSESDAAGWKRAAQFREYSAPVINQHWQAAEYPLDLVQRVTSMSARPAPSVDICSWPSTARPSVITSKSPKR